MAYSVIFASSKGSGSILESFQIVLKIDTMVTGWGNFSVLMCSSAVNVSITISKMDVLIGRSRFI